MKKIVGLGACVWDTLIKCKEFPQEDVKIKAEEVITLGGGPVGNALVVSKKLGLNAGIIGNFADDDVSNRILNDFLKYGVDTSCVTRLKNSRSFTSYVIISEKNKSRTCLFDRGTVPDDPMLVNFKSIDDAEVLHLDGNYIKCAIAAANYARTRKVKVSLDAGGVYSGIENLLPLIDILIPSEDFALRFTGEADVPAAIRSLRKRFSPEVLVVTCGSDGGYFYSDGVISRYNGIKVNAIDTNGAGDTFHGAFLVAWLSGKKVGECCEYASAVAAYKCTQLGARDYPLSDTIAQGLLKKYK